MSAASSPEPADIDRGSKAAHYDALAYSAIRALIDREHAVVWHEVEAKLAEHPYPGAPRGINPHHLTNARRRLLADGTLEEEAATTRGGQVITVLVPRDTRKRRDAIRTATRRKRALEGRYLSWAQQTAQHPNLIGDGGERVVHESLRATVAGYGLINPERGEVESLFGADIPGGPLDNAAHIALDAGDELFAVTILVEVKNQRRWFYPSADDLFQLLYKAAALQAAHPKRALLPVLVARAIHLLTFRMAKHLDFLLIQFDQRVQPILPHWTAKPEEVRELWDGLGYVLRSTDQAMPGLTNWFNRTLPKEGVAKARRWAEMSPALVPHFGALRSSTLSGLAREAEMDRLYRDATSIVKPESPWRSLDQEPSAQSAVPW